MASISVLFPKKERPLWTANLEEIDCYADSMIELPLLGWVTAGEPIDLCEDNETVAAPQGMVRKNSYALKVRGHSMIDDNIQDGDIIIVEKRESAENGQSVVALINGEQVTLKKFYVEPNGIRLQPANPDMKPIYLHNNEVQVLGIVSGVIRTT
ncbi:SOS-response repressor and protease LexA [hydrothermal vent metagenome]|uniref:SOS-response repressor and protease LexA n=1 Tax=hydrothermal vent metagenome TaxID=652676 RepID=A0A3B0ZBE5_9ZZZZ